MPRAHIEDGRPSTDRGAWLLRLIWVRAVVFSVFVLAQPELATDMLVLLAAVYALSFCWFGLLQLNRSHAAQAYAQIAVDLLLITWTVGLTGGLDSYFSSLYFLEIVMSGILLNRRGAWVTATVSAILHGTHMMLAYLGVIPSTGSFPELTTFQTTFASTLVGFFAVGYLSDYLADRWHTSNLALEESTGRVAFLQALTGHIIDSLGSGLITTDLDGRIYVFNPEAARITRCPAEQAVGQRIRDVIPELPKNPEMGRFEIKAAGPDQRPASLEFSVTPLTMGSGAATGHVWCFDDVTGLREMEQELRGRDRMAAIGAMSAGMAHEIRNPLASITGSFNLLQSELDGEEQRELGQIIARETERLNQIVSDFLLYARPIVPRLKLASMERLISDAVQLMRNSTDLGPGHEIETTLDPLEANVDEDMMRQVFFNLASNAFRAMPESGKLRITLHRRGDKAQVTFEDSGVGMTKDEVSRSFVPFSSSFSKGTGLGLAIVYQIIQGHGGSISVESTVGKGTTFKLEIPVGTASFDKAPTAGHTADVQHV